MKRIWLGGGLALFAFTILFSGLSSDSSSEKDFFFFLGTTHEIGWKEKDSFVGPFSRRDQYTSVFLEKNTLVSSVPPVMASPQVLGYIGEGHDHDQEAWISEHTVQEGETLSSIASHYELSLETLLWTNDLNEDSIIRTGQKLVIPPVDGLIHHVESGDTIGHIARLYEVKEKEIISFNELSPEGDIFVGDILVIPGGTPPPAPQSAPSRTSVPSSYFIYPVQGRVSQGLHYYNAVDFAISCGNPISAAAAGQVQRVRYGWNGGGGNYLTVLHPNGVVTYYGHILKSTVSPGQRVHQGQTVATVGGQPGTNGAGISTGCHVHFGVHGASNPFRGIPVGTHVP